MAIIDKIQLSGTVYTIGNETTTAVTSASTDNEIPTAKAVYDAIPQGGGGESCTVDSTTMFYTFSGRYTNDELDMMARYVVLDYGNNKTEMPNVSVEVNLRDIDYITYVTQNISLNYSTSSYTLGDISQAEYIDVTYDSTIEDFKIAVATAYTSTVFVNYITFHNGNIKVPFYTISSGSPCTAIENDIPTVISELGNSILKGLKEVSIGSQQDAISINTNTIGGNGEQRKIKLDEIDGSGSTLKPDIYIGLGRIGWTEINLSQPCTISSLKATKYRVTYNNSELDSYSMGLQFIVEYGGNEVNSSVNFDETHHPSLQTQDLFSAATVDWNDSTKELVITYPETIELYGIQQSVNIREIFSNGCNFGNAITKLESYGEEKQALKPYVKETRAALSGKQDTLVSGTNIKTINNQSILGEGNIEIQGGSSGGKAISAGRGISVTTGETADTVSFNLPISAGTRTNALIYNSTTNAANGTSSHAEGEYTTASGNYSHAEGYIANAEGYASHAEGESTKSKGDYSHAEGKETEANGDYSHSEGFFAIANGKYSHAEGYSTITNNSSEHASGQYNNSVSASTTFGDSGNTLFSVGNGTSEFARHNAFEIRQNGDIYISKDGQDVKLQDQLGGGGGSITIDPSLDSGSTNAVANSAITNAINSKMDKVNSANFYGDQYSAGLKGYYYDSQTDTQTEKFHWGMVWQSDGSIGFDALGNLAVFNKLDTSAITTSVTSSSTDSQVPSAKAVNDKLGGLSLVKLTQSEYDSLTTKNNSTLYVIVN